MTLASWRRAVRAAVGGPRRRRLTLESLEGRDVPAPLAVLSQLVSGGPGDQAGTGLAVVPGPVAQVYVSANSDAADGEGLLARYDLSGPGGSPTPLWSQGWPGAAGFDSFNGVAATPAAVYAAGASHSRTTDTVGGKEHKGITAAFPVVGGPSTWERQTPGAPGAFPYGGYEQLNAISSAVEAGQTVLYVTGSSQQDGLNGGRQYVSKVDAAGTVLWTRSDTHTGGFPAPNTNGIAVAATGAGVVVAGHASHPSGGLTRVQSYDAAGTLLWSNTTATSAYLAGVAVDGGFVYAVGRSYGANTNFVAQKFTAAGALVWSQTYDRGPGEDALYGVTLSGGRLFAAGATRNGTAGGSDGVVLELDPATGALVETTLWGGAADDSFAAVSAAPTGLHVVGTTRSSGGGAEVAYVVFDDAAAPALSVGDAAAAESGGVSFTVTLSAPSSQAVSVTYTTADGTADGADYAGGTGTLVIPAGQLSGTITVAVTDDNLDEADETFGLLLSDPVNATLGAAAATGTIVDDDATPAPAATCWPTTTTPTTARPGCRPGWRRGRPARRRSRSRPTARSATRRGPRTRRWRPASSRPTRSPTRPPTVPTPAPPRPSRSPSWGRTTRRPWRPAAPRPSPPAAPSAAPGRSPTSTPPTRTRPPWTTTTASATGRCRWPATTRSR